MNCRALLNKMTLEEKASLCSGKDFWHTKPVKRVGIPQIRMSDGPYGIRKQGAKDNYLDFYASNKTICFPAGCSMASSFNRELFYDFGRTLGLECKAEKVHIILGPAINIKRSPLGGRNFEYLSEDPLLSSELAAEYINGVQEQGVSVCLKHFAANNQETRRLIVSSNIDERTLREIYLYNFENTIKKSKPKCIMSSYNKINGVYVSENKKLLTNVLRQEWKYDGVVITDWGAICDRIKGLKAGIDIEMPSCNGISDRQIVEAVRNGKLDEAVLDKAVERILKLIHFCKADHEKQTAALADYAADHQRAKRYAEEGMVLLKNENHILPLPTKNIKVALIGEFAVNPRFQGGGSSHINNWSIDTALTNTSEWVGVDFVYARGYELNREVTSEELISEAITVAEDSDFAVVFAGLPESYESESYDRKNLNMPESHNRLIQAVTSVQKNTVVVLQNGSPVLMPWLDKVPAVLESYLGGEAVGAAILDILFGEVNPSGHLAETFPKRIEDTPAYLDFPGYGNNINYLEGVFVGYRYYISKKIPVLFPFGYGLSYTDFIFSDLVLDKDCFMDTEKLNVSVTVENSGNMDGKAVIQIYVEPDAGSLEVPRPLRELKAFEKIGLKAKQRKRITLTLDKQAFAYYDTELCDWHVSPGRYKIQVASDCEKVILEKSVTVTPAIKKPLKISRNSFIGDFLKNPDTREIMKAELPFMLSSMGVPVPLDESGDIRDSALPPFIYELPIRALISFTDGRYTDEMERNLLAKLKAINDSIQ